MATDPTTQELTDVGKKITATQAQLSAYDNPTSYLNLLQKVGDASYNANADLIQYRKAAREQLYGGGVFRPENYLQLSPEQQAEIRNAPRASLTAGIQAANETQNARANRLEDLLKTEAGRFKDTRTSLTNTLNDLQQRRQVLEGYQQTHQKQSSDLFFQLMKDYPDLIKNLSPKEQQALLAGNPDKKLTEKMAVYAKAQEGKSNIKIFEKNGYVVGIDQTSGKEVYRYDLGSGFRDYHAGTGTTPNKDLKSIQRLTKGTGYTFRLQQTSDDPVWFANHPLGVDFKDANGKKITAEEFGNAMIDKGISVTPQDVLDAMLQKSLATPSTAGLPDIKSLDAQSQTDINSWQAKYNNKDITFDEIPAYIQPYIKA